MKKKIVSGLVMMILSVILTACAGADDNEDKYYGDMVEKMEESQGIEEKNDVQTKEKEGEKSGENSRKEEVKEEPEVKNGYLFSTEYEIENYCQGYFIVSKMNKKLYGVLEIEGKEVIPLKYDKITFSDKRTIMEGRNLGFTFLGEYEDDKYYLNEHGNETKDLLIEKTYLDDKVVYYKFNSWIWREQKEVYFLNENFNEGKELLENMPSFSNNLHILRVFPLTEENYLVSTVFGIYLCDNQGERLWHSYDYFYEDIKKYNEEVIVKFNVKGDDVCFFSMSIEGEWKEVDGYYEDVDGKGIYKGVCPENVKYIFGENDDIFLKYSHETWKLVYKDDTPVYEDRYFDMLKYGEGAQQYFFLKNGDSEACLINTNGEKIAEDGTFIWEDGKEYPDFMGSSLEKDTIYAEADALYIVRQNGENYEVYRYGAQ